MYIVFDIGGTNMRIAGSEDGKTLLPPVTIDTPQDFEMAMKAFQDSVEEISKGEKITAIAGGIAGLLDLKRNSILFSPHLLGWVGKPLAHTLAGMFHVPVFIQNDTAMKHSGK